MMITITRLEDSDLAAVRQVRLAEQQVKFAGTTQQFLVDASESTHLHVIKSEGVVVGFFKLDTAYASHYDFCPSDGLGLRAFAVDVNQQGKGVGTGAVKALFPYLTANYSAFNWIYLTVNCQNPIAKNCYQKAGFVETGEQYLAGAAGPQDIMRGKIA